MQITQTAAVQSYEALLGLTRSASASHATFVPAAAGQRCTMRTPIQRCASTRAQNRSPKNTNHVPAPLLQSFAHSTRIAPSLMPAPVVLPCPGRVRYARGRPASASVPSSARASSMYPYTCVRALPTGSTARSSAAVSSQRRAAPSSPIENAREEVGPPSTCHSYDACGPMQLPCAACATAVTGPSFHLTGGDQRRLNRVSDSRYLQHYVARMTSLRPRAHFMCVGTCVLVEFQSCDSWQAVVSIGRYAGRVKDIQFRAITAHKRTTRSSATCSCRAALRHRTG